MNIVRLFLAGGTLFFSLQACMTTHQLQSADGLDASDALVVTTTTGERHSVTAGNLGADGYLRLPDSTLIPRESIASIEVSKINYLKTAVITAGIGAGTYAAIWFVRFVGNLGTAPRKLDFKPKFPWW